MSCSMKSYLRSHLRQNLKTLLYILAFAIAVTFIFSSTGQCTEITIYDNEDLVTDYYYSSGLHTPVTILAISCIVLPIVEFSFFKKRRNLDCAYALPISRRDMGLVHYLTGLLLLIAPYTCSYLVNFLLLLRYPGVFDLAPLLGHYFLCLALAVCFYSVSVFVFNQANSTGDGIWFIVLWMFVFLLLDLTAQVILERVFGFPYCYEHYLYSYFNPVMGTPMMGLRAITSEYSEVIEQREWGDISNIWNDPGTSLMMILWAILGIASFGGFCYSFGKQGAQKTEEISDSWFGYRVMIPIYGVCGMIVFSTMGMWLIIEGIAFVGYMIYRKGFHLKKSDWIVLALLLLLLLFPG